jgi:hypothetical protein
MIDEFLRASLEFDRLYTGDRRLQKATELINWLTTSAPSVDPR